MSQKKEIKKTEGPSNEIINELLDGNGTPPNDMVRYFVEQMIKRREAHKELLPKIERMQNELNGMQARSAQLITEFNNYQNDIRHWWSKRGDENDEKDLDIN